MAELRKIFEAADALLSTILSFAWPTPAMTMTPSGEGEGEGDVTPPEALL